MPTREQLWKQWEWEHEFTYLDTDGTRQFKPIQQPMSEQNTPTLLPVKFLIEATQAADRMYPNAHHGKIFEFFGPQMMSIDSVFTDEVPETAKMPPIYRLKMINGQWNLIV